MAKSMADDLPGSRSPPVRLCAECATRHHDRAVSRAPWAQAPLCTLCEASYDIMIGETPPPAPGEAIPGGPIRSSAHRGQKCCPRCRGLVSRAGYSWVHHMRICDPVYFQDEIERDASVFESDVAELEFLRPIDYSVVPSLLNSATQRKTSPVATPASAGTNGSPARIDIPVRNRPALGGEQTSAHLVGQRHISTEQADCSTGTHSGLRSWPRSDGASEDAASIKGRLLLNHSAVKQLLGQGSGHEESRWVGEAEGQADQGSARWRAIEKWATDFITKQRTELNRMAAEHIDRLSKCRERQAMLPMPTARLERTNKGNLSEPSGQEQQRRDVSSRLSAGTDAEVQKDHAASTADTVPLDVDDAACVVCNSMDDDSNMLLCDGCDDGYHIYCCTPKLSEIPDGDWFCEECRPSKKARHQETEDQPPSSQIQERSTHGPSATDTGSQNMAERVTQDGEKQSIEPVVVDQYASLEATQELSGTAELGTSGGLPDGGLPDVKISEDLHTDSSDTMTDPLLSAAPPPPPSRPPHGWVPRESTAGCDESLNTPFVDSLEFTAAEGWVSRSHRDLGLGMAASTKNAMVLSVHSRRIAVPAPGVSQQSDSNVIVAPLAPSLSATDDSQRKVSIVCPESFKEGDELEVAVPGRPLRIVAVTVPEGIAAGNLFYVRLPFNLVTASDDEQNSEDECQDKLRGHTQNKRKKEKSRSESSECPGSSNDGDGAPTRQAETGAEIVIASLGSECALGSCSPASNTHGAED